MARSTRRTSRARCTASPMRRGPRTRIRSKPSRAASSASCARPSPTPSRPQLLREIRTAKRNVKVPVSTAEPWHVWLHYPELAREVDYLAVHILPYWDEQSSEAPLDYLKSRIALLKQAYPNKNIIVTEIGWPSNGAQRRSRGSGLVKVATPAEHGKNVRDAGAWLRTQNINHVVV